MEYCLQAIKAQDELINGVNKTTSFTEERPITNCNKFLVQEKGPISIYSVNKILRKYSLDAELSYILTFQMLRRTFMVFNNSIVTKPLIGEKYTQKRLESYLKTNNFSDTIDHRILKMHSSSFTPTSNSS